MCDSVEQKYFKTCCTSYKDEKVYPIVIFLQSHLNCAQNKVKIDEVISMQVRLFF